MRCFAWFMFLAVAAGAGAAGVSLERNPVRTHPHVAVEDSVQHIIVKLRGSERATIESVQEQAGEEALDRQRVSALAARASLTLEGSRKITAGMHVMHVRSVQGESTAATLARLRADPDVQYAEPDQRRFIHAMTPNDPDYVNQWYEQAPAVGVSATPSAVDAADAWSVTTGSSGIVIADIDTGVRFDHPDLLGAGTNGTVPTGRLLSGYCFISDPFVSNGIACPGPDASDPGDWITSSDLSQSECSNAQASSSSWHGTRTAGILGALTNNTTGIAGVTWNTWILPLRALGKCGGQDSDIISAMLWAAGISVSGVPANPYPAKIINMSIGGSGSCPQSYQDAISQITARGVLIVASAGNEGGPVDAPGDCTGVAAVGGLRQAGTKVGFSNVGPEIALSAPAGNCVNTGAGQPCLYPIQTTYNLGTTTPGQNSYTDQINNPNLGTSFSAPIVSGIAALMVAANANLTSYQLIARLQRSATPFPQTSTTTTTMCHEPSGPSDDSQAVECICTNPDASASPAVPSTCGAGMANASAAVSAALDPIAAINVPATFSSGSSVTLDATGSAAACNHNVTTYQWVSSDPANHPVTNGSASKASVVAPASGSFVVTLTITDDAGRQDTGTVTIGALSATTSVPGSAGSMACTTPITVVSITPNGPSVQAGAGTISFAASVGDAASNAVTWQVNGTTGGNTTVGTISSTGVYTAPASQPSPDTVTVSAVSAADPTRSGWTQVTITPAVVSVAVSPTSATLNTGAMQAFTAKVTGSSNTAVTWQVNGATGGNTTAGTITSAGVYTAPAAVPSPAVVTVTAVSVAAPTDSGSASVTITAPASTGSGGGGSGGGSSGSGTGSTASPTGGKSGGGALDWMSLLGLSIVLTLSAQQRRRHSA